MSNQTNTRRKHLDELALKAKIRPIAEANAAVSVGDELTLICPKCGGTRFTGRYVGICEVICTFTGNGDEPFVWETHDHDDETLEGIYCYGCGSDYDCPSLFYKLLPGAPGMEPIA